MAADLSKTGTRGRATGRHIFNGVPLSGTRSRSVPFKQLSSGTRDIPARNGLSPAFSTSSINRPGEFHSRIPRRDQLSNSLPSPGQQKYRSAHFSSVNNRMDDEDLELPDTLTSGRRSRSKSRDRSRSRSRQISRTISREMSRERRDLSSQRRDLSTQRTRVKEEVYQRNRTREEIYQMAVRPVNKSVTPDFATLRMMAMNLSGRFTAKELKALGQQVLKLLLMEKDVDLFFGQQTVFRPSLPDFFDLVGTNKAFLTYDKRLFKVVDERHYRHFLRDLQQVGRIPYHYLPEQNYVVLKMTLRHMPSVHFLALSWVTDQCHGQVRATSLFRKLMTFASNLASLEELPIIVGGTFNLSPEEAMDALPEGFVCHGYDPNNKRRIARASNFFLASEDLAMQDVKPLSCAHLDLDLPPDKVWSPEDAFYNDPVLTTVVLGETGHMFNGAANDSYSPSSPGSGSPPGSPEFDLMTSSLAGQLSFSRPFPPEGDTSFSYSPMSENRGIPQLSENRGNPQLNENRNLPLSASTPVGGADVKQNGTGNEAAHAPVQSPQSRYKHLYDEDLVQNAPTCYMS